MTVSSELSRKVYTGDAVTTSFSTSPMVFFDSTDLIVYVVVTATGVTETLTENTHYTVTGGDGSTGTVNLAGGTSPYGAPAATKKVVIVREVPATQEFDPENNDGSDAEAQEDAFDKLTMLVQQNDTKLVRSLRQPDEDPVDIDALPNSVDRASKYLAFDADGNPVATAGTTSDLVATPFIETLLDDATAAAARSTLGVSATTPADDVFRVVGSADATKKLAFEVDGFTTGQTRTVTFPDANLTLPAAVAAGDFVQATSAGVYGRTAIGTAGQIPRVNSGATAQAFSDQIILNSSVATTSGTAVTISSTIPSWAKRLTLNISGVSTNGTAPVKVQLGTSGSATTSGYVGSAISCVNAGTPAATNPSDGFHVVIDGAGTYTRYGTIVFTKLTGNTWIANGNGGQEDTARWWALGGEIALAGALDFMRITADGVDTFDAGAVSLMWE